MTAKSRKYITGIDGLRTIAVIGVIGYHLLPNAFKGGFLGVSLFFVISGYLITDILISSIKSEHFNLIRFYLHRIRRLLPSLLILFLVLGTALIFLPKEFLNNFKETVFTSLTGINNFWQMQNGTSYFDKFAQVNPLTNLWSLSIEAQFYFIWPIIFLLMARFAKKKHFLPFLGIITIISGILMGVLYNPETVNRVYYGTDTRLFSLTMGCMLAFYLHFYRPKVSNQAIFYTGLATLLIAIVMIIFASNSAFIYYGGMFFFSIVVTILLFTVIKSRRINMLLTNRFFKYCGKISYEVYLWQFPVMIIYEKMFIRSQKFLFIHALIELVIILVLSIITNKISNKIIDLIKNHQLLNSIANKNNLIYVLIAIILSLSMTYSLTQSTNTQQADSKKLEQELKEKAEKLKKHDQKIAKEETQNPQQTTNVTTNSPYPLSNKIVEQAKNLKMGLVGDSVLLDASTDIITLSPNSFIDGVVGRQLYQSLDLFKSYAQSGKLGDNIVIALGTNGTFSYDELKTIIDDFKGKKIFLVNTLVPRPWQNEVNENLKKAAKEYKNVYLIDWYKLAKDHPDWFGSDQVHMNTQGSQAYANYLIKEVLKHQ